jgi:HlyD family secretion protein
VKRILLLLATVVVVAGTVYYFRARSTAATVPVTAIVARGDVVEAVDATGTVEPVTTVQVGTQVSGTIQALLADFNDTVRQGQVIARLEPSLFQAQVEQAEATLARIEADVERATVQVEDASARLRRARDLMAQQLISQSDLETAETTALEAAAGARAARAQVIQARASLNQARVNLGHTVITSPIDGIVISRNVDVGQTVAASMQAPTLFVLAQDLTRMQVRAAISEADIGRIQPAQPVTFTVDAYPGRPFAGTVSQVRLEPVVEQNVVSYTTVIDVPNRELLLKPGMTANVVVEIARSRDALRVPNGALRFTPAPELFASLGQPVAPEAADAASRPRGRDAVHGTSGEEDLDRTAATSPPRPRLARVWVLREGRLAAAVVHVGVNDGVATAVVGGDLVEGERVVTGVSSTRGGETSTTRSPLLPPGRGGARQTSSGSTRGSR